MTNQNAEYQAGAALVDEGIKIEIPGFWGKFKFEIKPLKPGTNVRISQKILKLEKINSEELTIQQFIAKGSNTRIIAGVIATAIINREVFKRWQYLFLKWLIMNKVESMEKLYSHYITVQRQMGPVFFYNIMALTPAMNFLTKKPNQENTGEEKPSGEQSHSSKKHSDSPTGK